VTTDDGSVSALIVDDQADVRRLLHRLLNLRVSGSSPGSVEAAEASSGEEALRVIDEVDPTVVVLDQCMPAMTGLETAQRILERRPQQPIMLLSAFVDEELVERATSIGVTLCLPKDHLARVADAIRLMLERLDGNGHRPADQPADGARHGPATTG
jgi:CheY-like chemotaxis protein